jgi:hypothetical protein
MLAYYGPEWESLASRMVGRWCPSFTGATGLQLPDTMGRNHGTLANMDRNQSWVTSSDKFSLRFANGSSAHVAFRAISLGTIHSCCAWVNPFNQLGSFNFGGLLGDGSGNTGPLHVTGFSATEFGYTAGTGGVSFLGTSMIGSWNHIASVRVGTEVSLFRNGIQVASGTLPVNDAASPDRIGQRNSTLFYSGLADDVTIFDSALTANELQFIYEQGRGGGMLYQPPRRRSYFASVTTFKNYWFRNQQRMIGGGVR